MGEELFELYELSNKNKVSLSIDICPYHLYHECVRIEVVGLEEPVGYLRKHYMRVIPIEELEYIRTHNLLKYVIEKMIEQVKGTVDSND